MEFKDYQDLINNVQDEINTINSADSTKQNCIDAWEKLEDLAKAGQKMEAEIF